MKYYVVVDTNVLVSASLKPESNPGIIFRLVDEGIIVPLINDGIMNEYRLVLSRAKFSFPQELVNAVLETMENRAIKIIEDHIEIELPDEKDRVFYEVVMKSNEVRNSRLVTGNIKHFPAKSFVVTPKELCDIILNDLKMAGEAI